MQNNGFSLPTSGIQGITSGITSRISPLESTGTSSISDAPTAEQAKGFQQMLSDAIGGVNEAQDGAKKATEALMTGKAESLHEVQIAGAKAEIEQEAARAKESLRERVAELAVAGAEKILRREIDAKVHADILLAIEKDL